MKICSSKKIKTFKYVLSILLIISVQKNGGRLTLKGSGCGKVSEKLETSEIYFYEKKQREKLLKGDRMYLNG